MASGILNMKNSSSIIRISLGSTIIPASPLPSLCPELLPLVLLSSFIWGLTASIPRKISPAHWVGKMFFFQSLWITMQSILIGWFGLRANPWLNLWDHGIISCWHIWTPGQGMVNWLPHQNHTEYRVNNSSRLSEGFLFRRREKAYWTDQLLIWPLKVRKIVRKW